MKSTTDIDFFDLGYQTALAGIMHVPDLFGPEDTKSRTYRLRNAHAAERRAFAAGFEKGLREAS